VYLLAGELQLVSLFSMSMMVVDISVLLMKTQRKE